MFIIIYVWSSKNIFLVLSKTHQREKEIKSLNENNKLVVFHFLMENN